MDELHLPAVARAVQPRVVVALNLTHDQLDRVHKVGRTAARWRALFAETEATVVANAADPHVTHAALAADPVWVRPGTAWTADAALCPRCSKVLDWHDLSWACRRCGLAAPEPDVTAGIDGIRVGGRSLAGPFPALDTAWVQDVREQRLAQPWHTGMSCRPTGGPQRLRRSRWPRWRRPSQANGRGTDGGRCS